jgi:hypothetical protein
MDANVTLNTKWPCHVNFHNPSFRFCFFKVLLEFLVVFSWVLLEFFYVIALLGFINVLGRCFFLTLDVHGHYFEHPRLLNFVNVSLIFTIICLEGSWILMGKS